MTPSKMVLGMPTYGRGNQLIDNDLNGLFCPSDSGFPMGPYTRQRGHFGFIEALQLFDERNNTDGSGFGYPYLPDAEFGIVNLIGFV